MIFAETTIKGAYTVDVERHRDDRGYFARSWCQQEFTQHGLVGKIVQTNISFNNRAGTLRGMHYQVAPFEEVKVVRVTRGSLFDVIVDLRPASPSFKQWYGVELSQDNQRALYIPTGCAHGFLTLADDTEVTYLMSEFFAPQAARGFRWNDDAFGIAWPRDVAVISDRDRTWPDFAD